MTDPTLDRLCIDTIRVLSVDAVERARSGHPGAPMGAAPMAYVLWDRFLRHNPADPQWPNRDRFVLSAGHASMLLFSLLHLTGYDLPLEEIKRFRQIGSMTPGHPEYGDTPGVEATTGPLGQGFANGVGMAIAERMLAERFNRPGHDIIDHRVYAIASDGDMMEGVTSEAASLAGTLRLGKLVYLYDDNQVSIEGDTDIAFTEDVGRRFQAYGWRVLGPIDGMDPEQADEALRTAQEQSEQPTLIICKTVIGYGSPNKAGTGAAHGEALGPEEARLTKQSLGWPYPEPFTIPGDALAHMRRALDHGKRWQQEWRAKLDAYQREYPEEARELQQAWSGDLPDGWSEGLEGMFDGVNKPMATRDASGQFLSRIAAALPVLVGGSADLSPSTKTIMRDQGHFGPADRRGRNLHFGVREHAMGSIASGIALHGGLIPYTATFLIFSDYMRPPMRLAAMMRQRVIYVFTHDSIGLGEDGPTHQPIEQLMGLRAIPNTVLLRPADATETVEAWRLALERRQGPTVLVLSRQNLPVLNRKALPPASSVRRGAYVLWEAAAHPDVVIIGTGSEVHLALEAAQMLCEKGIRPRVVSMPSWELFDAQPLEYRESVLPRQLRARVSVEAGTSLGWERYVGLDGVAIGLSRFGASAPFKDVYQHLGMTAARVAEEAEKLVRALSRVS